MLDYVIRPTWFIHNDLTINSGKFIYMWQSSQVDLLAKSEMLDYEGSSPPKSCFKFCYICRTCVVYKFFAEKTWREIEQTE